MIAPRLKDLGQWVSGGTPPRDNPLFWEGEIPWLSGKDFDRTQLREPREFISWEGARRHSRVVAGGRTVLVLVRGMALVHGLPVALLPFDAAINQDVRALQVDARFDPGYVQYALLAHRHTLDGHIDRAAHGTARVMESIYSVRVPAPDLQRQRQIRRFLDEELPRVAEVAAHARDVGEAARAYGPNALGERVARYPLVRVQHLGLTVEQGWSPETEDRLPVPSERECGVLKLSAVSTGRFRPERLKALPDPGTTQLRRYGVESGDVLMVRASGSLRLLGVSCHVDEDPELPTLFPDIVYRLRGDQLPGRLLVALLATPQGRDGVEMLKRGAANNKIRLEDVRHMPIPSPPPEDTPALTAMAAAWGAAVQEAETRAETLVARLEQYRNTLIYDAVIGRIDVRSASENQMRDRVESALEEEDNEDNTGAQAA